MTLFKSSLFSLMLSASCFGYASTIYQSAAYGTTQAPEFYSCSNCDDLGSYTQFVGERFSLNSTSTIGNINFYISPYYGKNQTITIEFYSDPFAPAIYSETFDSTEYTRKGLPSPFVPLVIDVYAVFSAPITLNAGDYSVFWKAEQMAVASYFNFGNSQINMNNNNGFSIVNDLNLATALRLGEGEVIATPLPAAAWLFSPALIPLLGYSRRKLTIIA